ncbi:MAG: hypothetical protein N2316_11445 [Spirochaetes bacterium]|nr:hypothetical protein [Spirochaetota bacterium]
MIRTTINLNEEVYNKLTAAVEQKGIRLEEILIVLMRHFSRKLKRQIITWKAVQYQERNPATCWKKIHVYWYAEEYEFLIDLRKVHKKSVSRLIAEAVSKYLNEIWSFFDNIKDNYCNQPYTIIKFDVHNIICCLFLWGHPQQSILIKIDCS